LRFDAVAAWLGGKTVAKLFNKENSISTTPSAWLSDHESLFGLEVCFQGLCFFWKDKSFRNEIELRRVKSLILLDHKCEILLSRQEMGFWVFVVPAISIINDLLIQFSHAPRVPEQRPFANLLHLPQTCCLFDHFYDCFIVSFGVESVNSKLFWFGEHGGALGSAK
jgi:hypothetical protein